MMSHTRNGMYQSKSKEIEKIQNKMGEMFDCISLLAKKPEYLKLSQKEQKQIAHICTEEKVLMKKADKKTYLSTDAISENLMEKIYSYDKQLQKIMPKKNYDEYCTKLIKDEFAKQSYLITEGLVKK